MNHNDVFKSLAKSVLNLDNSTVIKIFALADYTIDEATINGMLKDDEDEGYIECKTNVLSLFLDALIIHRRGRLENAPAPKKNINFLTNNDIMKKVRIAFELKEDDLLAILDLADFRMSRSEVNALFRKPGHKNFQECGNQFLRNFFRGLKLFLANKDK